MHWKSLKLVLWFLLFLNNISDVGVEFVPTLIDFYAFLKVHYLLWVHRILNQSLFNFSLFPVFLIFKIYHFLPSYGMGIMCLQVHKEGIWFFSILNIILMLVFSALHFLPCLANIPFFEVYTVKFIDSVFCCIIGIVCFRWQIVFLIVSPFLGTIPTLNLRNFFCKFSVKPWMYGTCRIS